jgi:hypothetical protein
MKLQNNSFMCSLALSRSIRSPEDVINAGNGVSVRTSPPVELDDTWIKWLGTLQANQFSSSKFIIVVKAKFGPFANDEGAIRDCAQLRANLVHMCLLLSGVGYTESMLKVCGHKRNHYLHVGPIQQQFALPSVGYRKHPRPTQAVIKKAVRLAINAERVYLPPYADRVRRGFKSIVLGWQSTYPDERLHNFIRAVEAIIKPGRGRITDTFVDRGQLFTGRSPQNSQLLKELYNIRSCYEHTKDVLSPVTEIKGVRKEHALAYRSLRAELLASAVYRRIFEKPRLVARFSVQQGFDDFWAQPEHKRKAQWGVPINLHTETGKQFFNVDSPEF